MTTDTSAVTEWLLSKKGLWGSSPDPAVRNAHAEHLLPYDNRANALSTLHGWTDPVTKKWKTIQTCGLHAMALLRFLGFDHPLLTRPYLGHNDVGAIVPAACKAGGRWIEDGDEALCELPSAVQIVRIDNPTRTNVHFCCVASVREEDSALVCIDGGQGQGNLIDEAHRIMVIHEGRGWLVRPEQPYLPDGSPNGRMITGRGVLL